MFFSITYLGMRYLRNLSFCDGILKIIFIIYIVTLIMMINKQRVAQFFHAALESYEQNSVAQQKIGRHLLQILLNNQLSGFQNVL